MVRMSQMMTLACATILVAGGAAVAADKAVKADAAQPTGRLIKPAEVARLFCFLLSDDASYVTAHCLVVDGGFTALSLANNHAFDLRAAGMVDSPVILRELIEQGAISPEQARTHPHRNVVTQALGVTDPQSLRVETVAGQLSSGSQILLCSDGLTEEVDDTAIAGILSREELSAQECVDHLILAALDGGGSDNVTVILLRRK